MTCKDCYHYEACKFNNKNLPEEYDPIEWQCDNFKDKSRIIELPCKIGDEAYYISIKRYLPSLYRLLKAKVIDFYINKNGAYTVKLETLKSDYTFTLDIHNVYFDKSKAEEKLKELNNEQD